MALTTTKNAFTDRVIQAMQEMYPLELADRSWDNVGLLLENAHRQDESAGNVVLLTNDLTPEVAAEAIQKKVSVIIAYHPIIFRGLKSLTLQDPQQRILISLAQANIAVYSPHTALDAAPGGINDWLARIVTVGNGATTATTYLQPVKGPAPAGFEGAGYGRQVTFVAEVSPQNIADGLRKQLGLRHVMVALPPGVRMSDATFKSVAVCAGSGWDVLKDSDAGILVTGEMSHHNALRATMEGKCVITVFHSNSERAFLKQVLQDQLHGKLRQYDAGSCSVLVSEADKDPFGIYPSD